MAGPPYPGMNFLVQYALNGSSVFPNNYNRAKDAMLVEAHSTFPETKTWTYNAALYHWLKYVWDNDHP